MMTYIELPVRRQHHLTWKLVLGFAVIFALVAVFYLANSVEAAVIYSNTNTYTKNGPDSSYYYTAFSTSFVPAVSSSFIKNTYEVKGSNTSTVKVRVYINGTLVEDSTRSGLVNNTWTAFSYVNSTTYYPYTLNAGTTYTVTVDYTRGNYSGTPYSVSIRNFTLNNNVADSTGPTFTLSTGQAGFGPYTVPPTRENIGPIYVNYYTASVVGSDVGSGISQMYVCSSSSNVSCYPGTAISGTNFSTQVAYNDGNGGKGVCYRARDNSGNWTPANGGNGGYLCTYFLRGLVAPSNVTGSVPGYGVVSVSFMDNSMEYSGGGNDERFYLYRQINDGEWEVANSTAIVSPNMPPGATIGSVSWTDGGVPVSACNGTVRYKAIAIISAMISSPESAPSNAIAINADGGFNCPLPAPSQCSAVAYSGPTRVKVDWYDNHNGNEAFTIYRDNNDDNFNVYLTSMNGPAGVGAMSYNNYSPPAGQHKYLIKIHQQGCETCNVNSCVTDTVNPVQIAPRVLTLTSNKIYTNTNVTISYTAQANGGATISRYEVWRAPRSQAGVVGTWENVTGTSYTQTSYTDTPPYASEWLYGVHVWDNNGNCITEGGQHCGGVTADSLDPRAAIQLVVVRKDTISPANPVIVPPGGTYACSISAPLSVHAFSSDPGWPTSAVTLRYTSLVGGGSGETEAGHLPLALAGQPRVLQAATPTCSSSVFPSSGLPVTQDISISVIACDGAGNQSSPVSASYICNTAPPSVTFGASTPTVGYWTNQLNISVPITFTDSERVSYGRYLWCPAGQTTCDPLTTAANVAPFTCNGSSTTCTATVTYSTDGAWYVCARGRDTIGNWNNTQCKGFYGRDRVNPTLSVTGPSITNNTQPSIVATAADSLSGINFISADFYDVEYGWCGSGTVVANPGTFILPSECYSGYIGSNRLPIAKNYWQKTLLWLKNNFWPEVRAQNMGGDGTYYFVVQAYDKAGNASNQVQHPVTIDTSPPASVAVNTFGYVNPNTGNNYVNSSNVSSIIFSGTCSENGSVTYVIDSVGSGLISGSTTCSGGVWSTPAQNLTPFSQTGLYVYAILFDAAGNSTINYRQGIKDTVLPTTPSWRVNGSTGQQYSCAPNPTNSSMQVGWNYSTDANGIKNYIIQSYGCSCSSTIGGACSTPQTLGSTWSHPTNSFSSYTGDGFYSWQVGAVDNANNSGNASTISPTCFSDHTIPAATQIIDCDSRVTTCSPTTDTTPTVEFVLGADPVYPSAPNCTSGSYCANVEITRENGSSCGAICLAPGTTNFTMWSNCYTGDGRYNFNFETQDLAGNQGPPTSHLVMIDTDGPKFGAEITSSVNPRAEGVKPTRNYTVLRNGQLDPETNSNFPVLTLTCTDSTTKTGCNIINMDPFIRFDPDGIAPAQDKSCSDWNESTQGKLRCGVYPKISNDTASTFEVYFDNWEGVGHNGLLTVDYTQIFADNAGNNAECTLSPCPQKLTISNAPPVITITGSQD